MRHSLKRFVTRRVFPFLLAVFGVLVLSVVLFTARCRSVQSQFRRIREASNERKKITGAIENYARPEESSYLTYPEWYIVYSYQERADFLEKNLPSRFPYFSSIAQYWRGYCCVYGITRNRYPFNAGDHLMLVVIGTSFSFEYAIRGAYEETVGRFTEWLSSGEAVSEDMYAYRVAKEYADFVHIRPFYEFSFATRLKGLWKETSLWGPHVVRKWERKAILSLDYGLEAAYCWLIEKASHATYGIESADTYVWIENVPDGIFTEFARVQKVKELGPQSYIVVIPRYREFTDTVPRLARRDVHFVEIAGNDEIMLSAIAPRAWTYDLKDGELLFATDILTHPDFRRIAVRSPVQSLHALLSQLEDRRIKVEHIYDY